MIKRWAYKFDCDHSIEEVPKILNEAGPWEWSLRENYIHGLYANLRLPEGARIKINEYPQGLVQSSKEKDFRAILEVQESYLSQWEKLDTEFKNQLDIIKATSVIAIEPYD